MCNFGFANKFSLGSGTNPKISCRRQILQVPGAKPTASGSVLFEPTSALKSTRIIPSIAASLSPKPSSTIVTIAFAPPNILELKELWREIPSDDVDPTNPPTWWKTLDLFGLTPQLRMELKHLARLLTCPHSKSTTSLSFLTEEGTAQLAITFSRFSNIWLPSVGSDGS